MERLPDVVEFYVTTTVKHVVNVADFAAAVAEGGDRQFRNDLFVQHEIPEDRDQGLTAIAVYAEGEFICEYDATNRFVTETDDRAAIVVAALAAHIDLPGKFAAPGGDPHSDAYQRLDFLATPESIENLYRDV